MAINRECLNSLIIITLPSKEDSYNEVLNDDVCVADILLVDYPPTSVDREFWCSYWNFSYIPPLLHYVIFLNDLARLTVRLLSQISKSQQDPNFHFAKCVSRERNDTEREHCSVFENPKCDHLNEWSTHVEILTTASKVRIIVCQLRIGRMNRIHWKRLWSLNKKNTSLRFNIARKFESKWSKNLTAPEPPLCSMSLYICLLRWKTQIPFSKDKCVSKTA